eukprot:6184219-Pleurochrysis_carterae.AAC.2
MTASTRRHTLNTEVERSCTSKQPCQLECARANACEHRTNELMTIHACRCVAIKCDENPSQELKCLHKTQPRRMGESLAEANAALCDQAWRRAQCAGSLCSCAWALKTAKERGRKKERRGERGWRERRGREV